MQSLQDKNRLLLRHHRGGLGDLGIYLLIHSVVYTDSLEHCTGTKIPNYIDFTEWGILINER